MTKLVLFILAVYIVTLTIVGNCLAADMPQMDTTAQPNKTIIQIIDEGNPECPEWLRKTTGYSKLLTDLERCGKQIRLHKWKCVSNSKIGWTAEVYQLEKCK